jgi:Tol biopolymer transport system component
MSSAQWLTPKTLQASRNRLVAVSANNKVYFAGGYDGGSVSNKIDVYDNATGDLGPYSKNLTVGRADMTAVWNENRNKIYFAGGNTNGSKSNVIEVLNLSTGNFESQLTLR